jgi:hypothetical protein
MYMVRLRFIAIALSHQKAVKMKRFARISCAEKKVQTFQGGMKSIQPSNLLLIFMSEGKATAAFA